MFAHRIVVLPHSCWLFGRGLEHALRRFGPPLVFTPAGASMYHTRPRREPLGRRPFSPTPAQRAGWRDPPPPGMPPLLFPATRPGGLAPAPPGPHTAPPLSDATRPPTGGGGPPSLPFGAAPLIRRAPLPARLCGAASSWTRQPGFFRGCPTPHGPTTHTYGRCTDYLWPVFPCKLHSHTIVRSCRAACGRSRLAGAPWWQRGRKHSAKHDGSCVRQRQGLLFAS